MGEVACTLIINDSESRDLILPDNVPIHLLIVALVKAFKLPNSLTHNYDLALVEESDIRVISNSRSLNQGLVLNGSIIKLMVEIDSHPYKGYLIANDGFQYKLRESNIVGRLTMDNHVDIDISNLDVNKVVSRNHANISIINKTFFIKDNKSRNGVFVNGVRIPEGQSIALQHNDLIRFGSEAKGVELRFKVNQ